VFAKLPARAVLFGEAQGRIVVSTPDPAALREIALRHGIPSTIIGEVGSADEPLEIVVGHKRLSAPLPWLDQLYFETIPSIMSRAR
jgi:phosphoribosylformylglycinamidine synthase